MNLRRTVTAIAIALSMVLTLLPTRSVTADESERVEIYDIRYNCICGPNCPTGQIIGHWEKKCDGTLTGWGEPIENADGSCKTLEVSYGRYCSPF